MSNHSSNPRNRLLALEQELQSRRSTGGGQKPKPQKHQRQRSQPDQTFAQAASFEPAAAPRSTPIAPKPHQSHRPKPAPRRRPQSSSWQALAERLTGSPAPYQPTQPSFRHPDPDWDAFPPSAEPPAPSSRPLPKPFRSQSPPPPSIPPIPKPPISSPAIALNHAEPFSKHTGSEKVDQPDDLPFTSWKDLATQIHRARTPQPTTRRSHSLRSSLPSPQSPSNSDEPDFSETGLDDSESFDTDYSAPFHLAQRSDQRRSEATIPTTQAKLPSTPNTAENPEQDQTQTPYEQVHEVKVEVLAAETSHSIFPDQTVTNERTDMAIAPTRSTETRGVLVRQTPGDRGILTTYPPRLAGILALFRAPQLHQAIPWLVCILSSCSLLLTQFPAHN